MSREKNERSESANENNCSNTKCPSQGGVGVTFLEHYLQVIRKGELTDNDHVAIDVARRIPRKHPLIPNDMMFRLCRNVIAKELGLWPTPDAATFNTDGFWFTGAIDKTMSAPLSPEELLDLYSMMPPESRQAFLKLVASQSTAEVVFLLALCLGEPERKRLTDMIHDELLEYMMPTLYQDAVRLARQHQDESDEELVARLMQAAGEGMAVYTEEISALERAKLKASRDRKSDPEIVLRNVEICDRRKEDPNLWTQGKLGKHYDVSAAAIRLILKDEQKWRLLKSQLSSN